MGRKGGILFAVHRMGEKNGARWRETEGRKGHEVSEIGHGGREIPEETKILKGKKYHNKGLANRDG